MKLHLDQLGDTPTSFRFEADDEFWATVRELIGELAGEGAERPFVALRAHRMGPDVYLEGTLDGELDLGCSRCLARYRHPLREPFRLVLEPAGHRVPAEPEAARALARSGVCLTDKLEMGWFQGHELDLGAFFLEVIALALPVQPLCREDCKGLCPRCGADRNNEQCSCRTERADTPFAALRVLRDGPGGRVGGDS